MALVFFIAVVSASFISTKPLLQNDSLNLNFNLKLNVNSHVYIHVPLNKNATLTINGAIIKHDDCVDHIHVEIRNGQMFSECVGSPSKRSLLPYTTQIVDDLWNSTEMVPITQFTANEVNEMNVGRMNDDAMISKKRLLMAISIVLMVLLIIFVFMCLCLRGDIGTNELRDIGTNENNNQQNHSDHDDDLSSDTLTFDGIYNYVHAGNDGNGSQSDHEMYLDRMNEMLRVKSISVIST